MKLFKLFIFITLGISYVQLNASKQEQEEVPQTYQDICQTIGPKGCEAEKAFNFVKQLLFKAHFTKYSQMFLISSSTERVEQLNLLFEKAEQTKDWDTLIKSPLFQREAATAFWNHWHNIHHDFLKDNYFNTKYEIWIILQTLAAWGANINALENTWGLSVFHMQLLAPAIYKLPTKEHCKILKALIEFGANLERTTKHGETPLQLAISCYESNPEAYDEIIKLLLDNGADPNKEAVGGLYMTGNKAICSPEKFMTDKLFSPYVRASYSSNDKQLPLCRAIFCKYPKVVKLLLEYKADPYKINPSCTTRDMNAFDFAEGITDILEILENYRK